MTGNLHRFYMIQTDTDSSQTVYEFESVLLAASSVTFTDIILHVDEFEPLERRTQISLQRIRFQNISDSNSITFDNLIGCFTGKLILNLSRGNNSIPAAQTEE